MTISRTIKPSHLDLARIYNFQRAHSMVPSSWNFSVQFLRTCAVLGISLWNDQGNTILSWLNFVPAWSLLSFPPPKSLSHWCHFWDCPWPWPWFKINMYYLEDTKRKQILLGNAKSLTNITNTYTSSTNVMMVLSLKKLYSWCCAPRDCPEVRACFWSVH